MSYSGDFINTCRTLFTRVYGNGRTIFYGDYALSSLFTYILCWSDTGQLITTKVKLMGDLGMTYHKVSSRLKILEANESIHVEYINKELVITVIDFEASFSDQENK